jgi:cytochrome c-type biogenesis protein
MTVIDLALGLLAGIVSCLTFGALLLFPLSLAAAAATNRSSVIAPALGLGLSFVLAGLAAGGLGALFGLEAIWFRKIVCALLILLGVALMSASMLERYPRLTGGPGGMFHTPGAGRFGDAFRLVLLAIFVGANWYPPQGTTLVRASAMAADVWNSGFALAVLFAFGVGAAVPWIVLGRVLRLVSRPFMADVLDGMAGKRILGLVLLAVAIVGITGLDVVLESRLDALLPAWTRKLSVTF